MSLYNSSPLIIRMLRLSQFKKNKNKNRPIMHPIALHLLSFFTLGKFLSKGSVLFPFPQHLFSIALYNLVSITRQKLCSGKLWMAPEQRRDCSLLQFEGTTKACWCFCLFYPILIGFPLLVDTFKTKRITKIYTSFSFSIASKTKSENEMLKQ